MRRSTLEVLMLLLLAFASWNCLHGAADSKQGEKKNKFREREASDDMLGYPNVDEDSLLNSKCPKHVELRWQTEVSSSIYATPLIADINSDGKLEVVVPSFVHYLEVLEGSDGDKMAGWPAFHQSTVHSSPLLFDIDKDGTREIALATYNGVINFFRASGYMMHEKLEVPRRKVRKDWYVGLHPDPVDRSHPDIHDASLVHEGTDVDSTPQTNGSTRGVNASFSTEVHITPGTNESKVEKEGKLNPAKAGQTIELPTDLAKTTMHGGSVASVDGQNSTHSHRRLLEDGDRKGVEDAGSESKNNPSEDSGTKAATVENNEALEDDADASFDLFREGDELADEYNYDYDDYVDESMWNDEDWDEGMHEKMEDYVDVDSHILCTPVIADIDNDGISEMIVAVSYFFDREYYGNRDHLAELGGINIEKYVAGSIVVFNLDTKQVKWTRELDLSIDTGTFRGYIYSSPTVVDLDGDGNLDILVGTSFGLCYVLDHRGNVREKFPLEMAEIQAPVIAADINDDGKIEIVTADAHGNVAAWTAQGDELWEVHLKSLIPQRIEAINSTFDRINEHRTVVHGRRHVGMPAWPPTSSLVQKACIFGRKKDLKAVEDLLSDVKSKDQKKEKKDVGASSGNNISVIAIVGIGGLGKTTLAQLAYNDDSVTNDFDMKFWVHVSENFDVEQMTRAMIESSDQKPCHLMTLESLHKILREKLSKKRFLLALDNVWEDQYFSSKWETFTAPLLDCSEGSKIIITTRNEAVLSNMTEPTSIYHLPCLKDKHCMAVFNQWAFEGQHPCSFPNLMAIGEEISMKCKGLPLAAKTLGGLLRGEDDEEVWNNILDRDIWDIGRENGLMPILSLSYERLPAHLRRCFRYCSLFPKGYQFEKDELVRMWMAQGYVQMRERIEMEDTGKEYFDDLLRRSFFQNSQSPKIFLMHDFIHDLARKVSRDECCSMEGGQSCSIPTDVRHISIVHCRDPSSIPPLGHIDEPRTLRSLIFWLFRRNFSMEPINSWFTQMEHLRVLDLRCIALNSLPSSISCLKCLRYLGLRSSSITELPDSVGSLYHLQTLDLEFSDIISLPNGISNLLNLRHIICEHGFEYPVGIEKLNNLQTMAGFHVSPNRSCAKLGELKDIGNIRSLCISGIGNLTDLGEAKKACLKKKKHLRSLELSWESWYPSPIDNDVLESLEPNPKLEWLKISQFKGESLPSWLGQTSFSRLSTVTLVGCGNWTSLPPLGKLPSLRFLSIESTTQVEYIGHEFFSGGFRQLETLELSCMGNWKSWCGAQRGECCKLRKLKISYCPCLTSLSVTNLDALQGLEIMECNELQFSSDSLPHLWKLPSLQNILVTHRRRKSIIQGVFSRGGIQSLEPSWLIVGGVGQLGAQFAVALCEAFHTRHLTVTDCSNLASLPLGNLSSLQRLKIRCYTLQSLSWSNLNSLQHLEIYDCPCLQSLSFGNLNSLETLHISHCGQLRFSNQGQLPSALRTLFIYGCPFLTEWCQHHRRRLVRIPSLQIQGIDKHVVLRNVFSVQEATDAYLGNLQGLITLRLEWDCHAGHGSFRDNEPEEVLNSLQPHNNLNKLVIQGYIGSRFATWLGDLSFTRLVSVTLLHCSRCELLPPLGQLPFLTELYIREAHMLRCIGKEFFYGSCSVSGRVAFSSLTKLEFSDMPRWEEWAGMQDGCLPYLYELIIMHCPMLKALPRLPPSLGDLKVENCDVVTFSHSFDHITSLGTLTISQVPVLMNLPGLPSGLRTLVLQRLPALANLVPPPSLRDLVLQGCSEVVVAASLPRLTLLTSLRISDFPELTTIPLHNLGILQTLHISNCPELTVLDCFSFSPALLESIEGLQSLRSLECLSISHCPKLGFSANERPPSALQYMAITNCPYAEPWYDKHWRSREQANW